LLALAGFTLSRLLRFTRRRPHPIAFRPMLRTTPSALELMPETQQTETPPRTK
ncbi:MFS transporter, partial [Xanthomonas perforans]|nr:MFS transporter [Xanthomonas perforans]